MGLELAAGTMVLAGARAGTVAARSPQLRRCVGMVLAEVGPDRAHVRSAADVDAAAHGGVRGCVHSYGLYS